MFWCIETPKNRWMYNLCLFVFRFAKIVRRENSLPPASARITRRENKEKLDKSILKKLIKMMFIYFMTQWNTHLCADARIHSRKHFHMILQVIILGGGNTAMGFIFGGVFILYVICNNRDTCLALDCFVQIDLCYDYEYLIRH